MTKRAQDILRTTRPLRRAQPSTLCLTILALSFVGCSGSDSSNAGVGGSAGSAAGGANATGGNGNASLGGTGNGGGSNTLGGTANVGGARATGGANTIGGANTVGGTVSLGGTAGVGGSLSTGGARSTGGTISAGGSLTTGGANATGGTTTIGGSKATGGSVAAGGTKATGGSVAAGGTASTGGSKAMGGTTGAGGTKAAGGTVGTGGSTATGGATGTGGSSSGTDMCGRSTTIAIPSGYTKLTWHDEFDVDGTPNAANWGYETGFVRNNEAQLYQAKNASVSGGLLTITGKREQVLNPNYNANGSDWKTTTQYAQYTSASMTTSGKQSWKFGRFEMCAKIPISAGMWPAWWTLGVSGEWPSNGEIDIMEYYNGKILANVACGTSTRWSAKWDSATRAVNASWAASYHVWRMDWNSTKIDLYVDDSLMNTSNLSDMLNADGTSPFLQNAYMIVNLAIGGNNGGDPSGTTFPQQYLIDNIRVFQ